MGKSTLFSGVRHDATPGVTAMARECWTIFFRPSSVGSQLPVGLAIAARLRCFYHLAVETPRANLVEGMRWLQGTFSTRFNRLRKERGHLFQGRYKSLLVDPDGGLGPLCHYIHLNPVRAGVRSTGDLAEWPWSSVQWLMQPRRRPTWYSPAAALAHAGGLKDTPAGRRKYQDYLAWLVEDEPARREQRFAEMSQGWVIGTADFAKTMVQEHAEAAGTSRSREGVARLAREEVWQETLEALLRALGRTEAEVVQEGKSVGWKLAVAAAMKERTTATNRWLAASLRMGNLHEVSRKVATWRRAPDATLMRKLV